MFGFSLLQNVNLIPVLILKYKMISLHIMELFNRCHRTFVWIDFVDAQCAALHSCSLFLRLLMVQSVKSIFFCYIDKNSNSCCIPFSCVVLLHYRTCANNTMYSSRSWRDIMNFRKFKRSVIVDIWKRCYVVSWIYCQLCSVSDVVLPGCRRCAFFKRSKTYYVQDNGETLEILSNNIIV